MNLETQKHTKWIEIHAIVRWLLNFTICMCVKSPVTNPLDMWISCLIGGVDQCISQHISCIIG